MFKRLVIAFIGINLMSLGLSIVLDINWGVGPFDSMTLLIKELMKLNNFSNASFVLHMSFALILIVIMTKIQIKITDVIISCLSIFIITRIVGVYENFIVVESHSIVIFLVAFLTLNLGLYLISKSNIIIAPYDKFVVEIAKYKSIELGKMRFTCDALLLFVVLSLNIVGLSNVVISFGTLFITFGTGLNISLYSKLFEKI